MRLRERIDVSVYLRALAIFARNPTVVVVPLLVAVLGVLVGQLAGATGGDLFGGGILGFILQILQLFALGVSIIVADAGWRARTASFDDAWQDARRKAGDLLFAAFGFTFVLQIAIFAGTLVGFLAPILAALAVYGLIFALPAAAIGGIPGGAAIGVSIDRVRAAPLTAAILAVVAIVGTFSFDLFLGRWLGGLLFGLVGETSVLGQLLYAAVRSIATGYVAVVMAKVYADVAFTR